MACFAACGLEVGDKDRCNDDGDCNTGRVCQAGICGTPGDDAGGGPRADAVAPEAPPADVADGGGPGPTDTGAGSDACADGGCSDPFADDYCTGTPMSSSEVSARLGDAGSVDLARVRILSRSRACQDGGCGPWQADTRFAFVRLTGSGDLPYQWSAPLAGTARVGHSEINSDLAFQITSDDAVTDDGAANVDKLRVECFNGLGTAATSCRSWAEYWRNGSLQGAPTILVGDGRAGFSGLVTDHCLRFMAEGTLAQAPTSIDNQVVVAATY
jgi:hypothetical protein